MTALATYPTSFSAKSGIRSRRRVKPWLGVDIGTSSVKLVIVRPNAAGQWELTCAYQVPWPDHTDPFASPEFLGLALREVLAESRADWECPRLRKVAFSLPQMALSQQAIATESLDAATIEQMTAATIQEIYGDRPSRLAFDTWQPDAVSNSFAGPPSANLVWADPAVVSESLAAFRRCGLVAEVLDTEPLTTARAAELATQGTASNDDEPVSEIVIDWGATGITLTWLFDGQPRFQRTSIDGGVADAVQVVQDTFSLSVPEAELMLSRYGLADSGKSGLASAVENCVSDSLQILLDELDRTLSFLSSRFPRQPVTRCLLTGGGAAIRNLDTWLGQQTGLAASVWSLKSHCGCLSQSSLLPAPVFAHAAALSALAWEA